MHDWQQRVVDEKAELDTKLDRLCTFLNGKSPLPADEKARLEKQHRLMNEYSAVLAERIENFKE